MPENYLAIRKGLCGPDVETVSCKCEPGAEMKYIQFEKPVSKGASLVEVQDVMGKCRPMYAIQKLISNYHKTKATSVVCPVSLKCQHSATYIKVFCETKIKFAILV